MNPVLNPMVMGLGTTELLIIFGVLILLFGAKKLPDLARGSGRALRIFKSETKGLMDDDDETKTDEAKQADRTGADQPKQIDAHRSTPAATPMDSSAETPVEPRRSETDR